MINPHSLIFAATFTALSDFTVPALIVLVIALAATFVLFRPRHSGLSRERSAMAFAITWLDVIVVAWFLSKRLSKEEWTEQQVFQSMATLLLIAFAIPFAVRLYSKWIGGKLTAAESAGGMEGVRAWLAPVNCILALLVAVLTWQAFDTPLPLMLMFTFGLLFIVPAMHKSSEEGTIQQETGGSEREKVLAMLEAGRISVEESADLLHALAASQVAAPLAAEPLSPARRLVLIGACTVLVGFFFPWYSISPVEEIKHTLKSLGGNDNMPIWQQMEGMIANGSNLIQISVGSEMKHGMGWMALSLAMAAALLPLFAKSMDRPTQRLLQLLALGVGSIILLSLVSTGIRWVGFGLVIALAGYAIQWIGVLRGRPSVGR